MAIGEGAFVAGRYRVLRRAGSGGMATVYEASDAITSATVALKTLRVELDPDARARARMLREAQALAEVVHPGIVRYVDHGVEDGTPFLVMEWVAGDTLREALDSRGLAPHEALHLIGRLASGLAAAHARGVVHRDLKPSNIMLVGGAVEQPMIVDFGVARLAEALGGVTVTGDRVGTPRYMAPEQIRSARGVDPKGDVFALGSILFECLTGRPAFDAMDPVTVLARILFEPMPVPSTHRPELPKQLDSLVAAMMQRDVGRRLSAAAVERHVADALAKWPPTQRALGAPRRDAFAEPEPTPFAATEPLDMLGEQAPPPSFKLGENAIQQAVRRALPPLSGELVDREQEQPHLVALLGSSPQTVVLWGGVGMGKTCLAVAAVRRAAAQLDPPWDALVYGDLTEARAADDIVRTIATEAGVAVDPSDVPEVALARALDKLGRVLLILDRIERVAVLLATLLRPLARHAPRLRVLAISRKRWTPPGAVALELGPLPTTPCDDAPSPAARLLLDRAAQLGSPRAGFLGGDERALVERAERLADALEGIPLAIELAVANLPVLGFEGLVARVLRGRAASAPSPPALGAPMVRVLEESWSLLSDAERQALAMCAVFRGGFTADAAEAVISSSGPLGSTVVLLQSLRDHSLLHSRAVEGGEVRLSMFSPVHDFAVDKLRELPELVAILRRHASHYARAFDPGPTRSASHLEARIRLEAENLFAAAEFSLSDPEGDAATGMQVLSALESAFTFRRGAALGYADLLDRALARAEAFGRDEPVATLAMRVRQIRARLDAPSGRTDRALRDLQVCLRDAIDRKDAYREGVVLLDLGVVHHLERAWTDARRYYDAALERLGAEDDPSALGRCLGNLGALCHDEGDFVAGARLYRRAIHLLERTGEERQRATFLANLAVLEQELGNRAEASRLYDAALTLLEPIRDARLLAIAVGNLGVLELEEGRLERAASLHERCLGLLAGSGDVRSRALSLMRLAAAMALMDRTADAEARLDQATALCSGDLVLSELGALTRAFLELSTAQRSLASGDSDEAKRNLAIVQTRLERAASARDGAHALHERSDDIRSTMRILSGLALRLSGHCVDPPPRVK